MVVELLAQAAVDEPGQHLVDAGKELPRACEQPFAHRSAQQRDELAGHLGGRVHRRASSAFSAVSASSLSAVSVARGAKYRTRTGPSASSRRSASVKPRSANLLAL